MPPKSTTARNTALPTSNRCLFTSIHACKPISPVKGAAEAAGAGFGAGDGDGKACDSESIRAETVPAVPRKGKREKMSMRDRGEASGLEAPSSKLQTPKKLQTPTP